MKLSGVVVNTTSGPGVRGQLVQVSVRQSGHIEFLSDESFRVGDRVNIKVKKAAS